jgi:hypothetical protein
MSDLHPYETAPRDGRIIRLFHRFSPNGERVRWEGVPCIGTGGRARGGWQDVDDRGMLVGEFIGWLEDTND